jgi:thiamine-phosphate diphosphorylase
MVPQLHVITPASVIVRPDFLSIVRDMQAECGSRLAVHLRAAELAGRPLYAVATAVSEGASASGGWCVVNGRLDVGLAAGAQAVQLGQPALPVARARRVAGTRLLLGASVHAGDEAVEAARDGANFLVLGTIHPTPSHPGRRAAGTELIGATRAMLDEAGFAGVGIVAIGGIEARNMAAALAAGATGVAVQRAVWKTADPVAAARRLVSTAERVGQEAS